VIGTKHADRITTRNVRHRVLALGGNDTVTVKSGNGTCVDGGNGNDHLTTGKTVVHMYGGAGKDTIKVGNGSDHLYGGNGNDKITAGTGRDHLYGNNGNDRLSARGKVAFVNGGPGRNNIASVLRGANVRYARRHGCQHVHIL